MILITGASGTVGRAVLAEVARSGQIAETVASDGLHGGQDVRQKLLMPVCLPLVEHKL